MGVDISKAAADEAGTILAERIITFMRQLGIPNGLSAVGHTGNDIPALVQGTLPQHRVTKLSPIPAAEQELSEIFEDAMSYW